MGGSFSELRFVENTWHPRSAVNINYPYYYRSNKVRPNPNKAVDGVDVNLDPLITLRDNVPFPPE